MRAALRCQRQSRWRRHHHEARFLIAGIVQRIETAHDEGIVQRADRDHPFAEQRVRQPERAKHQEQVHLGDAKFDMLALLAHLPLLRAHQATLLEHVLFARHRKQPAAVDPGPKVGRDGDVGRCRDDAIGQRPACLGDLVEDAAEPRLRRSEAFGRGDRQHRHVNFRGRETAPTLGVERHARQKALDLLRVFREPGVGFPLLADADPLLLAERLHLRLGHQPGVVILVAGERQAETLDRVGDEADRPIGGRILERVENRVEIVPTEIGHQTGERHVIEIADDGEGLGMRDEIGFELSPPALGSFKDEGRVNLVGAIGNPGAQFFPARQCKRLLLQAAVFEEDDLPAKVLEQPGDLHEQLVGDDAVKALAVVVDDPPGIRQAVLPVFEQRLVDVAFIDFGVAHQADHAALRPVLDPAFRMHIILRQRGKPRHRDAEADRPGRKIDVVFVLGA